jgi:RimJ/RimL family protein N-acetyltransferase
MVNVQIERLVEPTLEIATAFTRWENDPALVPLTRPNQNEAALQRQQVVSLEDLTQRLNDHHIYLIYLAKQLIGEMSYQVDPEHLFKKEKGTAWIGITIGEAQGRGKGIGRQALEYLEQQIMADGLARIELGVFEFNRPAHALYNKLGYTEIGRVPDFTYWQGQMWQDIRMEKYLPTP